MARFIKKREDLNKIRNENGDVATDITDIQKILRDCCLLKTKMLKLKVENYVEFGGFSEDDTLQDCLSDAAEGLLLRAVQVEPGCIGVL